jgi:hypothetical protein
MPVQIRRHQTQWAAQFFAAAELTRRGYQVAITLGNAVFTDLMVESPNGHHFDVDVKGQSTRSFWLIKQSKPEDNRYFILVYVPRNSKEAPEYFIMSSKEMEKLIVQVRDESCKKLKEQGKIYDPKDNRFSGIKWTNAVEYTDWMILPK